MRCTAALGFLPIFIVAVACGGRESQSTSRGVSSDDSSSSASGGNGSQGVTTSGSGATDAGAPVLAPNVGDPGNCCEARGEPGCDNAEVAACVCEEGSYCCNTAWDGACVRAVDELGCGICPIAAPEQSDDGAGGSSSEPDDPAPEPLPPADLGTDWSSCCAKQSGAGCGDPAVEACVCYVDPYCCSTKWDNYCAAEAEALGCAACSTFNGSAGGEGSEDGEQGGAGGSGGSAP